MANDPDVGGYPHGLPPGQSNPNGGLPRVSTIPLVTVVVHVRHPRFRVDVPGDVVRVQRGRQAGADANELPDTAGCHRADGTPEETPVLPGHLGGDPAGPPARR